MKSVQRQQTVDVYDDDNIDENHFGVKNKIINKKSHQIISTTTNSNNNDTQLLPPSSKPKIQGWERFFSSTISSTSNEERCIQYFALGHYYVGKQDTHEISNNPMDNNQKDTAPTTNLDKPNATTPSSSLSHPIPWMDEHAVRIRAGILNTMAWVSILNVHFIRNPNIAYWIIGTAIWEFLTSSLFGLTPLAPIGSISTLISMMLYKEPLWVPAKPKRFAWSLGLIIATSCFVCWRIGWHYGFKQKHAEMMAMDMHTHDMPTGSMSKNMDMDSMGDDMNTKWCEMMDMNDMSDFPIAAAMLPTIKSLVIICLILTWLETSCGFCLGCFVYSKIWGAEMKQIDLVNSKLDGGECKVCEKVADC